MTSSKFDQCALNALAAELGEHLLAQKERITVAESCTGGWLAQCLTAKAGSSAWFECGFVTYSNAAKEAMLGIASELLEAHGAVSEAVAAGMAKGALARSHADWAIAITGIAGPGGGTPQKPVGTVCFAWAGRTQTPITRTQHFSGSREEIRAASVAYALQEARRIMAETITLV